MGAILVIEDRKDFAERAVLELQRKGYLAHAAIGNDTGSLYDQLRHKWFTPDIMEKLGIAKWDAILLDINLPWDKWGGVFLYNKLVRSHRDSWDQTLIFSVYAPSDTEGRSALLAKTDEDGAAFILRVFADTANILPESALSNKIGGFQPVIRRLEELGVLP